MSRIVIFSAADASAVKNLTRSVRKGVPLQRVAASRMYSGLSAHYGSDPVLLWGSPTGDRGRKRTLWKKIEAPAVAFFYVDGGFRLVARIWAKEPMQQDQLGGNPAVARAVWHGSRFEHIVYLDEVEEIDVSVDELKAAFGYKPGYLLGREFVIPIAERERKVVEAFGSVQAFRESVVGHMGTPPAFSATTAKPPTTLGTTYREENENAKAKRKDIYRFDPDALDRGTQGHAKTQNALAKHLQANGLTPRSWFLAEPHFDLAWEAGNSIHIAEVKSLTRQNEERQLRLAVGQVLRYEQQMAYKKKKTIKVIATEREPRDKSWMALCTRLGIHLAWPGAFDRIP